MIGFLKIINVRNKYKDYYGNVVFILDVKYFDFNNFIFIEFSNIYINR